MPQIVPAIETFARIKVVGVGGAGSAAIDRMVEAGVGVSSLLLSILTLKRCIIPERRQKST